MACFVLCFGWAALMDTCLFQMTGCVHELQKLCSYHPNISWTAVIIFLVNLFTPLCIPLHLCALFQCISLWNLLWEWEAQGCWSFTAGVWIRAFFNCFNHPHVIQPAECCTDAANIHTPAKHLPPYANIAHLPTSCPVSRICQYINAFTISNCMVLYLSQE